MTRFPATPRPSAQPAPPRPASLRNDTGASLVIILAFIVLLTVLVLAYFSYSSLQRQISQASVSQAAAEVFAKGAVNTIIGDLRQEILAGSTNISTDSAHPVYYPRTANTMVPALSGFSTNTGLENLVKISRSGSNSFSGAGYTNYPATNRASSVSTTAASQNGRYLSVDRWNAALLLGKNNTNSATDLTPANFTAPDWILVARDGSNPTAWNANMRWSATSSTAVIGRFAYAIYDEGGLLDMNAAGFPPGSSTNLIASKGSLAAADLSVIPGMTTNAISAMVGWRNFVTGGASGSFPSYTFSTSAQSNYFETMRTNTSGFLRTANTTLSDKKTDRMFVSRQQLIQFLTQGVAGDATEKAALQNALRYLGTFSRDLEQPSFRPDPDRPKNTLSPNIGVTGSPGIGNGNDAYSSDGSRQDAINPALLTVRRADGEPLLKRRFPLSRLALLKPNPSADDADKIKKYFGLTWDSANDRWVYDHGNPTLIFRLSEIPDNREPDFFEILKAAIHIDSLGKQFGGLDSPATPHGVNGITGDSGQRMYDGETQSQIMRIAANIIDQYDEDSYPTAINFAGRNFYGVENLPYLAGWQQMWYRLRHLTAADIAPDMTNEKGEKVSFLPPDEGNATGNVFPYESAAMIQPIIWNPHAPDTRTNPPGVPTQFRVYAGVTDDNAHGVGDGSTQCYAAVARDWWMEDTKTDNKSTLRNAFPASEDYRLANGMTRTTPLTSIPVLWRFPYATIDPDVSILTFNTGAGQAAFQEPYRLRAPNFPLGSDASNGPAYAAGRLTVNDPTLVAAEGGSGTVIGFFCGKAWTGPCISKDNSQKWLSYGQINADLKLTLQYKKDGKWYTYDVIPNVFNASSNTSTVDNYDSYPNIRTFRTCLRADPRTNRWGLFHLATSPSTNPNDVPADLDWLKDNGVDQISSNVKHPRYYLPQGITWKPSAASSYQATGNATGGPGAPGWINPSMWNPADLMVNLARTPNGNPNSGKSTDTTPGAKYYYADPDGVIRRASGWNFSGSNGLPLYTGNTASRPVVLNRPFRSIAELGYVFRDIAWKNLDVFSPESADTALLDVFCLNELDNAPDDVTVAGRVNLNTRQPKVLEALISGVSKAEGGVLTSTEAAAAAKKLVDWTTDATATSSGISLKGPLRNRGELIGKYVTNTPYASPPNLTGYQNPILNPETTFRGFASELTTGGVFSASVDASIPRRTESVIRALADAGNTRTWNLLVDIVAQVGRYPEHATTLSQFVVEGETRFWVHLAIDRFTGKIIAEQWEAVSE